MFVKTIIQIMLSCSILLSSVHLKAEATIWNRLDFNKPIYVGVGFAANEVALLSGEKQVNDITTRITADDEDFGAQFFLGMHYAEFFDIETRYQNLGSFKQKVSVINTPEFYQTNTDTLLDYQSVNFLIRPKFKLGKYFQAQAEAGLSYVMLSRDAKVTVLANKSQAEIDQLTKDAEEQLAASDDNEVALTYGVSILYQGNGLVAWRWALDRHQHGDEDFAAQSLSILYLFDRK